MKFQEKMNLALDTLQFPVTYFPDSQVVRDAKGIMICDVRGWGKIQFMEKAKERHDAIGHLLANLLNTYQHERAHFNRDLLALLA